MTAALKGPRKFVEVLEAGDLVVTRPSYIITATDVHLTAWRLVGAEWYAVAQRAGGAALFRSALDLHMSARNWVKELQHNGRL
jgi:hypothetical protein